MEFGREDVNRSFERVIVERGSQYVRSKTILDAWYDGNGDLRGTVQGSDFDPYDVTITIRTRRNFTKLESECTCPYGEQCKHGAAVALYAIANPIRTEPEDFGDEDDYDFRILLLDDSEPAKSAIPEYRPPASTEISTEVPLAPDVQEWLGQVAFSVKDIRKIDLADKQRLFYQFHVQDSGSGVRSLTVTPIHRTVLKTGAYGAINKVKHSSITAYQKPKHWTPFDLGILNDLDANAQKVDWHTAEYRLEGRHGIRLITELLSCDRCVLGDLPLTLGETKTGVLEWVTAKNQLSCAPQIVLPGKCVVLDTATPWYYDPVNRQLGPVECGIPGELAAALIKRGPIPVEQIQSVREALEKVGLTPELMPSTSLEVVVQILEPMPCLSVDFQVCNQRHYGWQQIPATAPIAFGNLTFQYAGQKATVDGKDVRLVEEDRVVIVRRNAGAEAYARDFLIKVGWTEAGFSIWDIPNGRGKSLCMAPNTPAEPLQSLDKVQKFVEEVVPVLTREGWKIDIDQSCRFVPETEVEWDIALQSESGIDWFEFKLGIRVEGEPFDLKPVLANLFRQQLQAPTKGGRVSDELYVFGLNGKAIKLSRQRLTAILQPLVELFGGVPEWPSDLRISKALMPVAAKFKESISAANVPWRTTEELARLGHRFATFDRLEPLAEPAGFVGELREYQKEGLAWLQFLREFDFSGVLADDMGLGKTVQVLAHIQTEKSSGRMNRPCLIVAPTSTMPNWRRECEKFAPELKVVTLQGAGRAKRFGELAKADIALTTYPLLVRDKEKLSASNYHLLVLDEAQNIKNATTAASKAVRELSARHRLCLSGTPVENHLGELWALFHFLMPGFLGSDADFRKRFRNPIEKLGDNDAREHLARRVRPFMLRRTKGQVVQELPEKIEIIETVEFDDPQRDLYESIRIAMDEQVRSLIASQGFDKSRIQILDALLKLRQVCCDPRLVKLPSAKAVSSSAKLDRLIEMLGVLIEDGRRVLLFSQFTSMLDLIEERLRENGTRWVRISGDTIDRETPVSQFQAGEVPLFLISLKAGGTGLNLTAADTVILYDPWWNPAVENQAIDRAHRIGQQKAVMVYKLVAAGTIEEKMLEMQARKGDIARSILSDDAEGICSLTADDLRWVLSKD